MKGTQVSLLLAPLTLLAGVAAAQPQAALSSPAAAPASTTQAEQAADDAIRLRDSDRVALAVTRKMLHDCLETGSSCPKSRRRADEAARRLALDQAQVNAALEQLRQAQHAQFQDLLSRTQDQRQDDGGAGGSSSGGSGAQGGRRHRRRSGPQP